MKPAFDDSVLISFPPPGPWAHDGACKGADPELFFSTTAPTVLQRAHRELLCGMCPVQAECLAYAVEWPDVHGFWGGTNDQDRRSLRAVWRREKAAS